MSPAHSVAMPEWMVPLLQCTGLDEYLMPSTVGTGRLGVKRFLVQQVPNSASRKQQMTEQLLTSNPNRDSYPLSRLKQKSPKWWSVEIAKYRQSNCSYMIFSPKIQVLH
ncbi:hypothetical protein TNCV_4297871 [Trichonephila clavipes]|nr:hypothetical protein TNCV_4297871 [Trichonephila clavipes]